MADLMSGTCTYSDLQKKYKNFSIPAVKININGTDIAAKNKLAIVHLQINLSIDSAGSCIIKLGGLYDIKSHSMDDGIKSKFVLGAVVEVEIGYGSSTEKVFKGYVARVGVEFGEKALFVVTLMDARRLMMVSSQRHVLHNVKNYSDAVKTVLSSYSKLCSPVVDDTNDKLENPIPQNQSDYDFIFHTLIENEKIDREFFIVGGKVYFRKPRSVSSSIMTLTYGKSLLSFSCLSEYKDMNINVVGYDPKGQEVVTGKATVKSPKGQKNVLSKTPDKFFAISNVVNAQVATERAKTIADREEYRGNTASAVTLGIPQLVPGRFVEVSDLEKLADRKYYITQVEHILTSKEYLTRLDMIFGNN